MKGENEGSYGGPNLGEWSEKFFLGVIRGHFLTQVEIILRVRKFFSESAIENGRRRTGGSGGKSIKGAENCMLGAIRLNVMKQGVRVKTFR